MQTLGVTCNGHFSMKGKSAEPVTTRSYFRMFFHTKNVGSLSNYAFKRIKYFRLEARNPLRAVRTECPGRKLGMDRFTGDHCKHLKIS